jgi:hypothetical protein
VFISLKKNFSFIFAVAFLFVTVSAMARNVMKIITKFFMSEPDNWQDAIKRFPANLQSGFQGAYIILSQGMSEDTFLAALKNLLRINFMKTNIILKGKGNEPFGDTGKTFLHIYRELKAASLQVAVSAQMAAVMSGALTPDGGNAWQERLIEWL